LSTEFLRRKCTKPDRHRIDSPTAQNCCPRLHSWATGTELLWCEGAVRSVCRSFDVLVFDFASFQCDRWIRYFGSLQITVTQQSLSLWTAWTHSNNRVHWKHQGNKLNVFKEMSVPLTYHFPFPQTYSWFGCLNLKSNAGIRTSNDVFGIIMFSIGTMFKLVSPACSIHRLSPSSSTGDVDMPFIYT
jgi:hypothetical protein